MDSPSARCLCLDMQPGMIPQSDKENNRQMQTPIKQTKVSIREKRSPLGASPLRRQSPSIAKRCSSEIIADEKSAAMRVADDITSFLQDRFPARAISIDRLVEEIPSLSSYRAAPQRLVPVCRFHRNRLTIGVGASGEFEVRLKHVGTIEHATTVLHGEARVAANLELEVLNRHGDCDTSNSFYEHMPTSADLASIQTPVEVISFQNSVGIASMPRTPEWLTDAAAILASSNGPRPSRTCAEATPVVPYPDLSVSAESSTRLGAVMQASTAELPAARPYAAGSIVPETARASTAKLHGLLFKVCGPISIHAIPLTPVPSTEAIRSIACRWHTLGPSH